MIRTANSLPSRLRAVALAVASFATLALALIGCGDAGASTDAQQFRHRGDGPIAVTATTGQVADLVRQVGGERVKVVQLMGPGVDPHTYKPREGDTRELMNADMVFYNGLLLEGRMADLFVKFARKKPVVAVSERIGETQVLEDEEGHDDPHVWFDPRLWAQGANVVRDALAGFAPQWKDEFVARAQTTHKAILDTFEEGRAAIATIPEKQRVLVTAHDAFRYFGAAFGLQVHGLQGISTESEASLEHRQRLVDLIVANNIRAVFVESSVNSRAVEALVESCAAKGHTVAISKEELFSDAMGDHGKPEGTYVGMLRHNLRVIVESLR